MAVRYTNYLNLCPVNVALREAIGIASRALGHPYWPARVLVVLPWRVGLAPSPRSVMVLDVSRGLDSTLHWSVLFGSMLDRPGSLQNAIALLAGSGDRAESLAFDLTERSRFTLVDAVVIEYKWSLIDAATLAQITFRDELLSFTFHYLADKR